MYGIPWALLSDFILFYYVYCIALIPTYFYLICLYFKLKLRKFNCELEFYLRKKFVRRQKLIQTLSKLNKVYAEINQFNNEFWSKILFVILTFNVPLIFSLIFELFYGSFNDYLLSFGTVYYTSFVYTIVTFFIIISSSMSNESFKASPLVRRLLIKNKRMNVLLKLKV